MYFNILVSGFGKFFVSLSRIPRKWKNSELVLWLVPFILVSISGILIASTQRQANYADWYNHWITAFIGFFIAILIAQLPIERIRTFLFPLYYLSLFNLVAVKFVGLF